MIFKIKLKTDRGMQMSARINFKTNYYEEKNLGDTLLSNKFEPVHFPTISSPETFDLNLNILYANYLIPQIITI
jgi:hypothetical protein